MKYIDKLNNRIKQTQSSLCVGLDPRIDRTEGELKDFLFQVIDETLEFTAAYKPNIAYFEALGVKGYQLLEDVIERIPDEVVICLDCKRGDISTTQEHYAKGYFDNWNVDSVTLSPYMGFDSLEPFLKDETKGAYSLALTSNPGSTDLQTLQFEEKQLFEHVLQFSEKAESLPGTLGYVMGLTNLTDEVLNRLPDVPLLIPGLGAQGGELDSLKNQNRKQPILINVSRGVLYGDAAPTFGERANHFRGKINDAIKG